MQPPNATDRNSSLQSEFHPSRVIFHPAPSFPRHPHVIMPPLRLHHHLERRLLNVSFPRMFQLSNVRRNLKIFQESYINQAGIVKRRKKFQKVQSPLRTCSFFQCTHVQSMCSIEERDILLEEYPTTGTFSKDISQQLNERVFNQSSEIKIFIKNTTFQTSTQCFQ